MGKESAEYAEEVLGRIGFPKEKEIRCPKCRSRRVHLPSTEVFYCEKCGYWEDSAGNHRFEDGNEYYGV